MLLGNRNLSWGFLSMVPVLSEVTVLVCTRVSVFSLNLCFLLIVVLGFD